MISICIATYNGEKYLFEQISSILPQIGLGDEIIISDDGSTDKTLSIIRSFNDARIKVFKGPCKGHPKFNFENALKHCSGDFIFLCDQDDIWEDNKVTFFLNFLGDYDLVVSNCFVINKNGQIIRDSFFSNDNKSNRGFFLNLMHNHYLGCCMAFNRKVLEAVIPFPPHIAQHDIWIGLCAELLRFDIVFIPEKLMRYRRHDGNFSFSGVTGGSENGFLYKISYRLYFLLFAFVRFFTYRMSHL